MRVILDKTDIKNIKEAEYRNVIASYSGPITCNKSVIMITYPGSVKILYKVEGGTVQATTTNFDEAIELFNSI